MNTTLQTIPLTNLALAFMPVAIVIIILIRWQLNSKNAVYALIRMLAQLLLIGFFLDTLFTSNSHLLTFTTLAVMVSCAAWIALMPIKKQRKQLFKNTLLSILAGGGATLTIVSLGVIELPQSIEPRVLIPLGGMIFANAMTSISLAAERFLSEIERNTDYKSARNIAFNAAMIPVINSLFAVGLVSLPGMMTGQILSGISPFIAARYQIMVMAMIFASTGLSTACFLRLIRSGFN